MGVAMLRPGIRLVNLIVLPISFLAYQSEVSQGPKTFPRSSPTAAKEPNAGSLVLELDRAIVVLKRGLKEDWETRDQYLNAFEKTPSTDSKGRPVRYAKSYVKCAIGEHLRTREIWDEGSPIEVEVQRTITEFIERREGQAVGSQLSSCAVLPSRKVVISAGVASDMLKTKVGPVYPAEAFKNHVSGTVVLHAVIDTKGHVEAIRIITGPASLQQAAFDAVRQWTYRPYLLNDIAVEVETTINVVFTPGH